MNSHTLDSLVHDLFSWYQAQARVLPWRDDPAPYKVWISEIMLQQTQVSTVIPFFERFITRFPDIEALAGATEDEVMQYWAGLGYYSRARNIRKTAGIIAAAGIFPDTKEGLLELPGIGPYTAGAILSIAFNQAVPILDANIERVFSRMRLVSGSDFKKRLWRYADIIVKKGAQLSLPPRDINQALMELGALLCNKNPDCGQCPLRSHCKAYSRNLQKHYPPSSKKKDWQYIDEEMICLVNASGEILIRKTPQGMWRAGLWDVYPASELPGIKQGFTTVDSQAIVTRHRINRKTHLVYADSWPVVLTGTWVSPQALLEGLSAPGIGAALKKSLPAIIRALESRSRH